MKSPGQAIYHGESETIPSDGTPTSGDAVAMTPAGQVTTADGTDHPVVIGVASDSVADDHEAGDMISIYTEGTVVTNVAAAVGAGVELGSSGTEGQLAVGDGAGASFSAAGGSYRGPLPPGYAAVRFGGVV